MVLVVIYYYYVCKMRAAGGGRRRSVRWAHLPGWSASMAAGPVALRILLPLPGVDGPLQSEPRSKEPSESHWGQRRGTIISGLPASPSITR